MNDGDDEENDRARKRLKTSEVTLRVSIPSETHEENNGERESEEIACGSSPNGVKYQPLSLENDQLLSRFLEGEWDEDSAGSLTPRQRADPNFVRWIERGGGNRSSRENYKVAMSLKYGESDDDDDHDNDRDKSVNDHDRNSSRRNQLKRRVCNSYLVVFPVVRVRRTPDVTSDVVKKIACGTIVSAWDDLVASNSAVGDSKHSQSQTSPLNGSSHFVSSSPWVHLQDGGWVLTSSQANGTKRILLQKLRSRKNVDAACEFLKSWTPSSQDSQTSADTASSRSSHYAKSLRMVLNECKAARRMREVIMYQNRLISHLRSSSATTLSHTQEKTRERISPASS